MGDAKMTQDRFLKDVAEHKLAIEQDQGVFRHIRFAKPGSYCMSFMLTTWPGHLAITGDMGTFVFSRLRDMFEFFRSKPEGREKLYINLSYWAEKCEAQDNRGRGIREYDQEVLRRYARDEWENHFEERQDSPEALECWNEIQDEVLCADTMHDAHLALRDFDSHGFRFDDAWEWNLESYTCTFEWCCYAIAWGIQQYDAALAPKPQEES